MRRASNLTGLALITLATALAGCNTIASKPVALSGASVSIEAAPAWHQTASEADIARIAALPETWSGAIANARSARFITLIGKEGALLDPAAALPVPTPPPGAYRCRTVRLAAPGSRGAAVTILKSVNCFIGNDGPQLSFTKDAQAPRAAGWLWNDGDMRLVLLGATAEGREKASPAYGDQAGRDIAGVIERIGDFRWRLVIPAANARPRLDVIEMIPLVSPPPS